MQGVLVFMFTYKEASVMCLVSRHRESCSIFRAVDELHSTSIDFHIEDLEKRAIGLQTNRLSLDPSPSLPATICCLSREKIVC